MVKKFFLLILIVFLAVLPFFIFKNYLALIFKFVKPDYGRLRSENGVVSVLLLGKGGEGHSAPDLTDTMIDVFIHQNKNKISLLSLPRDIWVAEIRSKLNSAYYWDRERKNQNYEFVRSSVNSITGYSPSYIVVIDFNMFKDLIDSLNSIEVEVENAFVDNKFPISGKENDLCGGDKSFSCRYETVKFEKGIQIMNGETALKFVRSRNSQGEEGTDLAREIRQQKVIDAIKNKLFSPETFLNFKIMKKVTQSLASNIETDIDLDTAIVLSRLFFDSKDNMQNLSVPEDFLEVSQNSPRYDYQYVFVPRDENWNSFITSLQNQIY